MHLSFTQKLKNQTFNCQAEQTAHIEIENLIHLLFYIIINPPYCGVKYRIYIACPVLVYINSL